MTLDFDDLPPLTEDCRCSTWWQSSEAEMNEREAFEAALKEDPYDLATHRAFADWLMEQGGHDAEAEHHALWTPEWQREEDWMRDFVSRAGETCLNYGDGRGGVEEWVPVTYETVMQAAADWVSTCGDEPSWSYGGVDHYEGDHWTQMGQESLRNMMYDDDTRARFWTAYQTITRTSVDPKKQGQVFSCSC